ncbi:hypothetical protein PM082_000450 [Marasmius tenuissimus]|nr:hypothetical protein PM082_000450 [Marasmius tenuissimus]
MNTPQVLEAIKRSQFYLDHRAPQRKRYEQWIAEREVDKAFSDQLEVWKSERLTGAGGPYIEVNSCGQTFKIHSRLVALLQGEDAPQHALLQNCDFEPSVIEAVIELAYHVHDPFPLVHDILLPAAVPPFPSEALEEKLQLVELAASWKFAPVMALLSFAMDIEGVINVFQHAYIRQEAQSNDWSILQAICDQKERTDPQYAYAVYSIVLEMANTIDDEDDRRFALSMVSHLHGTFGSM